MKKSIKLLLGFSILAAVSGGVWYYTGFDQGPIYEFKYERDAKPILDIFKSDWYWLVADTPEHYSPEFMLKYKAPKQDLMWQGRMRLKILRENNEFIGFIAYYPESKELWFINFLAVKPQHRGKRHADKLVDYAMKDMLNSGAQQIYLITRPVNKAAQSVYKRFGFQHTADIGDLIRFDYIIN